MKKLVYKRFYLFIFQRYYINGLNRDIWDAESG